MVTCLVYGYMTSCAPFNYTEHELYSKKAIVSCPEVASASWSKSKKFPSSFFHKKSILSGKSTYIHIQRQLV